MKKNYVPQPMDTSDIQLPEELSVLIEQMAKNVHEVWHPHEPHQACESFRCSKGYAQT